MNQKHSSDFVVIKAVEDGVNVIGLTRGTDTKFHHSEKLDKGEVIIAQFTEHTSAIKVRGEALIQTAYGEMKSEKISWLSPLLKANARKQREDTANFLRP